MTTLNINQQYVLCTLGRESVGIPIDIVREVIDLKNYEIVKVPGASSFIAGVINLRGQIIPMINPRQKLKFGLEYPIKENPKALILENEKEIFGLIMDDIHEVSTVLEEFLEAIPGQAISKDGKIGRISGKDPNQQDQLVFLLSKEQLFDTNEELTNLRR